MGQAPASAGWAGRSARCGCPLEPQVPWEVGRAHAWRLMASVVGSQSPSPYPDPLEPRGGRCVSSTLTVMS